MNFEIFAERVQYDELFQKELKKNSCSLEMSYGYFTIFDSRCFTAHSKIELIGLELVWI